MALLDLQVNDAVEHQLARFDIAYRLQSSLDCAASSAFALVMFGAFVWFGFVLDYVGSPAFVLLCVLTGVSVISLCSSLGAYCVFRCRRRAILRMRPLMKKQKQLQNAQ